MILKPFIWLIRELFQLNINLIDNYGWSLIFLSFQVTLIMLPFYYLAERWKRAEEKAQDKMEGSLSNIKESYEGQKRYYLIREIHRIYNYKTFYSLRVTMGLLIQIPLFLAAYSYLSSYTAYQNVSFGPLGNLASQDHLLGGINIMPFVMTAVNMVSSLIYARGSKRSDKIQLVVMSLLFLALLYDRPCGLVLYWTMNNLFGLPKNLWLKKVCPPVATVNDKPWNFKEALNLPQTPWLLWGTALTLFNLELSLLDKFYRSSKLYIPAVALLGGLLTILFLLFWVRNNREKIFSHKLVLPGKIIFLWLIFLSLAYDTFFTGYFNKTFTLVPVRAFLLFLQFIITGFTLHYMARPSDFTLKTKLPTKRQSWLFFLSLFILTLFFTLLSPVITYSGAASDLQTPLGQFVFENLQVFLSLFILGLLPFFFKKIRLALVQFTLFLLMLGLIYYYIIPSPFGLLDGNVLAAAENLDTISYFLYFLDGLIILGVLWLSGRLIRNYSSQLLILLLSLLIGLVGEFTYKIVSTDFTKESHTNKQLPSESDVVHGFSKDKPNVIVFVADMFTGGYMENIKKDNPEIIEKLDGFTWFPNTLSLSYYTVSSMPAIIGGGKYSPQGLNSLIGNNRLNTNQSYYEVLVPLAKQGWSVSLVDPHQKIYGDGEDLVTQTYADRYYSYWKDINNYEEEITVEASESTIVTMMGIFHAAPYSLKKTLYSGGNWVVIPKKAIKSKLSTRVRKMWGHLNLLPQISHTQVEGPTIKYVHSYLTHMPYAIDREGNILTSGFPDPQAGNNTGGRAAYYSAREFMKLFVEFTDWLKTENIYDNTMIILVSDHGNFTAEDDPSMPEGIEDVLGSKKMYNRAHPMLMVKGFNDNHGFQQDMTLMSNGDTIDLISQELNLKPYGFYAVERPLTYSVISDDYMLFLRDKYVNYQTWQVSESIFDVENWQRIEKK